MQCARSVVTPLDLVRHLFDSVQHLPTVVPFPDLNSATRCLPVAHGHSLALSA
jgi:hypothetical protein